MTGRPNETKPGFVTGRGGDELEPIIDPAGRYDPQHPQPVPVSATDVVDHLLSDVGGWQW